MRKNLSGRNNSYKQSEFEGTFEYRYDKINLFNDYNFRWFGDIYQFGLYSAFPCGINSRLYNWLCFYPQKFDRNYKN